MSEKFFIECTDQGQGPVFDAFLAGYEQAFTLAEEMESREGFVACLNLNHGDEYARLTGEFGRFRELCLTLHASDGSMVAGANLFAMAHREGPLTVNLNYIYVLPNARGQGILRHAVDAVARAAAEAFSGDAKQVLIFIEQNDPLRMSVEDQNRDTLHSGMDQFDRLSIWRKLGACIVDFPYVQPPLSPDHAPNEELILSVVGNVGPALSAGTLASHLRGFFGISVAKGGDLAPSARDQIDRLLADDQMGRPVALIDPRPALTLPRPRIGDWEDFRMFARHAADQAPISA